jgi:hypothetical protein
MTAMGNKTAPRPVLAHRPSGNSIRRQRACQDIDRHRFSITILGGGEL